LLDSWRCDYTGGTARNAASWRRTSSYGRPLLVRARVKCNVGHLAVLLDDTLLARAWGDAVKGRMDGKAQCSRTRLASRACQVRQLGAVELAEHVGG